MRWFNKLLAKLDPEPSRHTYRYLYARGTELAHTVTPFKLTPTQFSIVTDKPELRYHDGVTPGGIAIPLDQETWKTILASQVKVK